MDLLEIEATLASLPLADDGLASLITNDHDSTSSIEALPHPN
jgi:hypothetical protein